MATTKAIVFESLLDVTDQQLKHPGFSSLLLLTLLLLPLSWRFFTFLFHVVTPGYVPTSLWNLLSLYPCHSEWGKMKSQSCLDLQFAFH